VEIFATHQVDLGTRRAPQFSNRLSETFFVKYLWYVLIYLWKSGKVMERHRAVLKPMQPMLLHWAPSFWGPAPWYLVGCSFLPDTPCTRGIQ